MRMRGRGTLSQARHGSHLMMAKGDTRADAPRLRLAAPHPCANFPSHKRLSLSDRRPGPWPAVRLTAPPPSRAARPTTPRHAESHANSMSQAVAELVQHQLLPRVSKPNRYLGNALHAPRKPLAAADVRL